MALLEEQRSQHCFYLAPAHWFGRNLVRANTLLDNADASQLHAHIAWNGRAWELLDHSQSGSTINGVALAPHSKTSLATGQILQFGTDTRQRFKIINLDAPGPMLIPLANPQAAIALHARHGVPDEHAPLAFIHKDRNGAWLWEIAGSNQVLQDGDTLRVAGQDWLFFDKPYPQVASAPATPDIPGAHFDFTVSQNEEHVQLALKAQEKQIDLGERTHHYCLLTLARKRFLDAQQGFDRLSQGWISTNHFAAMLGVEEKHANMLLHRVRAQLSKETPMGDSVSQCIERRRGELRFGTFGFRITRGAKLEAVFEPEY